MPSKTRRCHGFTRSGARCKKEASGNLFCAQHPSRGGLVTKSGFADIEGVDASRVSQWLAADTIDEDDQGRINWQKAQRQIEDSRDLSRPLQRDGEGSTTDADEVKRRHRHAKMLKAEEQAKKAQLERLEVEGELVRWDVIEGIAFDEYRRFRSRLLSLPDELPVDNETRNLIEEGIRKCLMELTTGAELDGDTESPPGQDQGRNHH